MPRAEESASAAKAVTSETAEGARATEPAMAKVEKECERLMKSPPKAEIVGDGRLAGTQFATREAASLEKSLFAEDPGLSKGLATRNATYRTVSGTGEKFRIVRPLKDIEAELEWAPKKWDAIRQCTDDVEKIAQNTGLPEKTISQIKEHVFYKEHLLDKGIGRFDPDADIAAGWDRLYHGDFIKSDLKLLDHEHYEFMVEVSQKTTYREAHKAAEAAGKNWQSPKFEN